MAILLPGVDDDGWEVGIVDGVRVALGLETEGGVLGIRRASLALVVEEVGRVDLTAGLGGLGLKDQSVRNDLRRRLHRLAVGATDAEVVVVPAGAAAGIADGLDSLSQVPTSSKVPRPTLHTLDLACKLRTGSGSRNERTRARRYDRPVTRQSASVGRYWSA